MLIMVVFIVSADHLKPQPSGTVLINPFCWCGTQLKWSQHAHTPRFMVSNCSIAYSFSSSTESMLRFSMMEFISAMGDPWQGLQPPLWFGQPSLHHPWPHTPFSPLRATRFIPTWCSSVHASLSSRSNPSAHLPSPRPSTVDPLTLVSL